MEVFVLDAVTGAMLGQVRDEEMLSHVRQFPDDYIVWERFEIKARRA